MKRLLASFAAFATLSMAPRVVHAQAEAFMSSQAQPWLADRRFREGIGIRTGDFELHPGLGAEFGYDSNYFHRADDPDEDPIGSLRLKITPSFSLSTLGPQRLDGQQPDIAFRAGVSATYHEFFPVSGSEAGQDLMSDQRNVGGALDAQLDILPGRTWNGRLFANLGRTINPTDEGITGRSFNRLNFGGGGDVGWAPGGGLFDWRVGYRFRGVYFEANEFDQLTNFEHRINTRGRWRFLPRSALVYDGTFDFINYPTGTNKTGSHPMRSRLGYNGLITTSFSLLAMAGWGASFYEDAAGGVVEDFDSVIGNLELKWFLTPNPTNDPSGAGLTLSTLAVGFLRDFADSYIGTYYEMNRGYLNFSYFFGGSFLLSLEGGGAAIVYPNIPELSTAAFTDIRVDGQAFGEYRFSDMFGINSTIRYQHHISDTVIEVSPGQFDSLQWQQFEAYLGARWFM